MDKNNKLLTVLEGIAVIVLGVLVAIFGTKTLALYFGIMFVIAAAGFLAISIFGLAKLKTLSFPAVLAFTSLMTFGVLLLLQPGLLNVIVVLFVYFVIALGGALFFYGIYFMVKYNVVYGIGQMTLGVVAMVLGILYLTLGGFRAAFWIVIGVVIALYGILLIVSAFTKKKTKAIVAKK